MSLCFFVFDLMVNLSVSEVLPNVEGLRVKRSIKLPLQQEKGDCSNFHAEKQIVLFSRKRELC